MRRDLQLNGLRANLRNDTGSLSANLSRAWRRRKVGTHYYRVKRDRKDRTLLIVLLVVAVIGAASAIGVWGFYYHFGKAPVVYGTTIGDRAPNFRLTLINGTNTKLSSYYNAGNHSIFLWFVTTWSSYCNETSLATKYYSQFNAKGTTILEIELYNDLGQQGPTLTQFANQYWNGSAKPGGFYGTSNQNTTQTYDPRSSEDIYYLLNSTGYIVTVGLGEPAFDFILSKS